MGRMSWASRLLVGLLLCGAGCHSTPPPATETDNARIRELEARIARLEAQEKASSLDDEILALEVERAGLLVTYTPENPVVTKIERRIQALGKMRVEEGRARRDRMRQRLQVERDVLLVTYAPDHPSVIRLDAKIAFLKADAG